MPRAIFSSLQAAPISVGIRQRILSIMRRLPDCPRLARLGEASDGQAPSSSLAEAGIDNRGGFIDNPLDRLPSLSPVEHPLDRLPSLSSPHRDMPTNCPQRPHASPTHPQLKRPAAAPAPQFRHCSGGSPPSPLPEIHPQTPAVPTPPRWAHGAHRAAPFV